MNKLTIDKIFLRAIDHPEVKVHFWYNKNKINSYSYQELWHKSLVVTKKLQQMGLQKGDRVAIVLPTDPAFYHAFFGIILAGGISAALYPPVRLGRMDEWKERTTKMLQSIQCRAVITDKKIYNLLGESVRSASPDLGCFCIEELVKGEEEGNVATLEEQDICVVQFSSGTTGNPKPVALTHRNILGNAKTILESFPDDNRENHSGVSWLPLYHDMGLVGCLFSAMMLPGSMTLIRPEQFVARPKIWLEALTQQKATISVAPNFAFGLCTNRIKAKDMEGIDLSSWKIALCGAEAIHPNTLEKFADHFAPVGFDKNALTPVYGLAEATLAVTFSPLESPPLSTIFDRDKLEIEQIAVPTDEGILISSVGKPLKGTKVEVRDHENKVVSDGNVGRVWIQGESIMHSYFQNEEATAAIKQNNWLDTGDQGFIYQDDLYLCGRYKDTIIIRGRNYSATEIEYATEGISGIRQGCIAAFSDYLSEDDDSESLIVLAEYRDKEAIDLEKIKKDITANIQMNCNIKASEILLIAPGTLPRTSSGKIRRNEARRLWRQNLLEKPGSGGLKVVLKESLKGIWQHHQAEKERKISHE